MSALLRVEGLAKRFGGLQAVDALSFELKEGAILGLIGPNGAGKSTVFNLIDGVIAPDAGRIVLRGADITGNPPYRVARMGLARTHQIVQPFANLTVLENCSVGACFGREELPLARARMAAREAAVLVGLGEQLEAQAAQLTIAGKKRLELARALAARPTLLLLDEVLAGLNTPEVSGMLDTIRKIRDQGITIIMIEHIMHAIMNLSHRILVLNYGELIAQGTPQEVSQDAQVIEAYLGDPEMAEKLLEEEAG
jgi:branched-chain amino acid transport system ATP-binding protein